MNKIFGIKNDETITISGNILKKEIDNTNYEIIFDGNIYNFDDIKSELNINDEISIEEVILNLYIKYKENMLNYINGDFAFCICNDEKIFIARDRLGVKPIYYANTDKSFVFATDIKDILNSKILEPIMSKEELLEMIGLGPAHTPSKTYFKNILELEAGNYLIFENNYIKKYKYWDLAKKDYDMKDNETISYIKELVTDSTNIRLNKDISSTLSGGLDSTIVTKIAKDNNPNIKTYSINYEENDLDFKANPYQQSKDSEFVKIASSFLDTNHLEIDITQKELYENLINSVKARNFPGMADIDSSMYVFCKKLKDSGEKTILSGECSDEIFGGYPWFYKENLMQNLGFPWALSENLRENLVKKDLVSNGELTDYIISSKNETLKNIPISSSTPFEKQFEEINYLTIKYFMNTLIERTERAARTFDLDFRMPFSDYRIFDFVYSIPAKKKLGLYISSTPIEKCLLRFAFKEDIPISISQRKKSPFPKTYSKKYLNFVERELTDIINNPNSRIHQILDTNYITHLIESHGEELKENLFGQLMTYPQTLAYIIQIEYWLKEYNIKVEI